MAVEKKSIPANYLFAFMERDKGEKIQNIMMTSLPNGEGSFTLYQEGIERQVFEMNFKDKFGMAVSDIDPLATVEDDVFNDAVKGALAWLKRNESHKSLVKACGHVAELLELDHGELSEMILAGPGEDPKQWLNNVSQCAQDLSYDDERELEIA